MSTKYRCNNGKKVEITKIEKRCGSGMLFSNTPTVYMFTEPDRSGISWFRDTYKPKKKSKKEDSAEELLNKLAKEGFIKEDQLDEETASKIKIIRRGETN